MKSIIIFLAFSVFFTFSIAITQEQLSATGFLYKGPRLFLKGISITVSKEKTDSLPFDNDIPLSKILYSPRSTGRPSITKGIASPSPNVCSGPGPGSGVIFSPVTIGFSPPGVPTCLKITGPPSTCLCSYSCSSSGIFKECCYKCGTTKICISGKSGFSCNIFGGACTFQCPNPKVTVCSS